jgi:hypothetical protein
MYKMYEINFTGMRQVNSHEGDDGRTHAICMQLWKSSLGITAMWTFLRSQLHRVLLADRMCSRAEKVPTVQ